MNLADIKRTIDKRGERRIGPLRTQVVHYHDRFYLNSNDLGYVRFYMVPFTGEMGYYNQTSTHSPTVLGTATTLNKNVSFLNQTYMRVASSAFLATNVTPISTRSGAFQAYEHYLGPSLTFYDHNEDANQASVEIGSQSTGFIFRHLEPQDSLFLPASTVDLPSKHTIGFMFREGVNQRILIQYQLTLEVMSYSQTDAYPYSLSKITKPKRPARRPRRLAPKNKRDK